MQIQNIYSIFDSAAGVYSVPFFQISDAVAIRMFKELANNPEHTYGKHPDDFTLFKLGYYNDEDASFEVHAPVSLGNAIEFLGNQIPSAADPQQAVAGV